MSRLQARNISHAEDARRVVEERGLSYVRVVMRELFVAAVEGRV